MDNGRYYLDRKFYLDGLSTKDKSKDYKRIKSILEIDSIEGLKHEIEDPFMDLDKRYIKEGE